MDTPDSADMKAYRDWKPELAPVGYQYGNLRNQILNRVNSPIGSYDTPELREQRTNDELGELGQNEADAWRKAYSDLNAQEGQKRANLSGLTKAQLVNTGGSNTGTSSTTGTTTGETYGYGGGTSYGSGSSSGTSSGTSSGNSVLIQPGGFLNSFLGGLGSGIGSGATSFA